jgi:predicted alpha/beta-fold hydrolase
LTVLCTRYGGHCGFVERLNGPSFADEFVVTQFELFSRDAAA